MIDLVLPAAGPVLELDVLDPRGDCTMSMPKVWRHANTSRTSGGVCQGGGTPAISVVIPCLNECATIAEAVMDAKAAFAGWPGGVEVVVVDNGSTDGSAQAQAVGARVIRGGTRLWGSAPGGFRFSKATYIVYADADLTYNFGEGPQLVTAFRTQGTDLAMGTVGGHIERGAMPLLHKRMGTPVLTALINSLFGGHLTDCNSGFRALR